MDFVENKRQSWASHCNTLKRHLRSILFHHICWWASDTMPQIQKRQKMGEKSWADLKVFSLSGIKRTKWDVKLPQISFLVSDFLFLTFRQCNARWENPGNTASNAEDISGGRRARCQATNSVCLSTFLLHLVHDCQPSTDWQKRPTS